jgi:hypothetical protein
MSELGILFHDGCAATTLLPFQAERTRTRRIMAPPENRKFARLRRAGAPWYPWRRHF